MTARQFGRSLSLFVCADWRPFSHATHSLENRMTQDNFVCHSKCLWQHIWPFYDGLVGEGRKGGCTIALCRHLDYVYSTCTIHIGLSRDWMTSSLRVQLKSKGSCCFFNSHSNDSIPKRSAVVRELEEHLAFVYNPVMSVCRWLLHTVSDCTCLVIWLLSNYTW